LPVAHLVFLFIGIWPGLEREMLGQWPPINPELTGPGAWLLLAVLAALLLASLWDRNRDAAPTGLVLLGLSVPVLITAFADSALSVHTALRWGLGAALLVLSLPFWCRTAVSRLRARLGVTELEFGFTAAARVLLLMITVGMVLWLTAEVAVLGFSGRKPAGPHPDSFFAQLGWVISNVVPLALVCLSLSGHGVRERSPGFLFGAGLIASVAVMGGDALGVVTSGAVLTEAHAARPGRQPGCVAGRLGPGRCPAR
jgi:hypothetical protein